MRYKVVVETARAELVAAVRTTVAIGEVVRAWKPAHEEVWAFLRAESGLRPGNNLFLYHHGDRRNEAMMVDFGVQVARPFDRKGNVQCVETPSGEVASTLHVGPYDRLVDAHNAIHAWRARNHRNIGQASWETYCDWNDDPALIETTIKYLLA